MKDEAAAPFGLNAVLYFLNYVSNVEADPVIPHGLVKQMKEKYRPELLDGIREALMWAKANPNFDYAAQIPVPYDNKQILIYLENLTNLLKREGVFREASF
jgi:hypothetical protein